MEMRRGGQTLAIVALLLVVLIGFLAVTIDVGNLYAQRRFMQNAADAAALAGARALALGEGEDAVRAEIDKYALAVNGGQVCSADIATTAVTVTVGKGFATYFAGVVGVPSLTVAASAAAGWEPAGAGTGLMPLTVISGSFRISPTGATVYIFDQLKATSYLTDDKITGGEFGWLDLCSTGGGAAELREEIRTGGCDCVVDIPQWVEGKEGVTSPVIDEFEAWAGQTVYIPVYDQMISGEYHLVGLAAFRVESYNKKLKCVIGTFEGWAEDFPAGGGGDFGLRTIQLRPLGAAG